MPSDGAACEFARAKVNLALHVTGRRADGYHLLDGLVAFAGVGDRLAAEAANDLTLDLAGPFAPDLSPDLTSDPDNLVLRAARLIRPEGRGARLRLHKALPVASGIGGGSADAAAALRLLARLWRVDLPGSRAVLDLGADVPACLAGQSCRMRGIGERLEPVALPCVPALLVNPGVPMATGAVFAALERRENPGLPGLPPFPDAAALIGFLAAQRNDLEAPAQTRAPQVGEVLAALAAQPGCLLARMSGSGATCFGLFRSAADADRAAADLTRARPRWWVVPTQFGG